MDRKEFLTVVGKGSIAVCTACFLASCGYDSSSNPSAPQAPQSVDFTLDLTQSANQSLKNVGGSLVKSGVIVARISSTDFTAVSAACTHEGFTLVYEQNASRFHCNNHGSNFSSDGKVLNGPAAQALTKYKTTLEGNNLRVFS